MIEPLELRRLLSAQLEDGLLRVTGTDGHDRFRLLITGGNLIVDQDGNETSFNPDDVRQILITTGDGDDQVLLFPEIDDARIEGGPGGDTLIGGDGNDTLDGGAGDDHLDGKLGSDVYIGGGGFDSADYRFRNEDLTLSINNQADDGANDGAEGDNIRDDVERIVGGSGNDRITGSSADNSIDARDGDDTVLGVGGNDSLDGGDGQDSLIGGAGNDRLRGQQGRDEHLGGDDDDTFDVADGERDTVDGGSGRDTVTAGDAEDEYRGVEDTPARPAPEISILRGGNNLSDGNDTIDFGSVERGGDGREISFTVRNDGAATLRVSGITVPDGYTLVDDVAGKIGPGESDTFTIRLDDSPMGLKEGTVRIASNDGDEDPFTFQVTGRVEAPPGKPEIRVRRGGDNIEDGKTTVGFGTHTRGEQGTARTFTVSNEGDGPLTLGNVEVPGGFTLEQNLPNSIAPGESAAFIIRIDTGSVGDKEGEIRFSNNDSNEDPFNFFITGRVTPPAPRPPEIVVTRGDETLDDGKSTVSFGSATQGGTPGSRTFTVRNTGSGDLTLGDVQLPGGYSLVNGLANRLAPGDSDTFTVRLDTGRVGDFNGEIRFSNNDADENPFNIKVSGSVKPAKAPEIAVFLGKAAIDDGGGTINFKKTTLGGKQRKLTFTVRNTGNAPLTIGKLRAPGGYRVAEGLSSKIQPGKSDTFTVVLRSDSAGSKKGQISFGNNDPNEDPFNFTISGRVTAPDIAVRFGKRAITDGSGSVDFGTVGDGASRRTHAFRVTNDGDATLRIEKVKVPPGYKVAEGLPTRLKPGESENLKVTLDGRNGAGTQSGRVKIVTNDPDEKAFDFTVTGRVLGVSATVDKSGSLIVNGTAGHDVITVKGSGTSVKLSANGSTQSFKGVKRIFINAGAGDDKVSIAAPRATSINGGDGNDTLVGGNRSDTLIGDAGNDRLTGGVGSDWLIGGAGKDILNARDGVADRKVDGGPGADRITTDPTDSRTGT